MHPCVRHQLPLGFYHRRHIHAATPEGPASVGEEARHYGDVWLRRCVSTISENTGMVFEKK